MKRIIAIAVCLLASLAGVASAQDHAARATVPFGFYVGNTWLPSGNYTFGKDVASNLLTVRNADGKITILQLTGPSDQPASANKLMFNKYGDQYFLREILCASHGMRLEIPRSRKEKHAETREARIEAPSTTYLALR